jgi:Glycosyl hydrolase family 79 C-terminal beta domain
MNRRKFLEHCAIAATSLGAFPLIEAKGVTRDADVTIHLHPERKLRKIASDFIGLGFETSSVAVPRLLSADNKNYVQLVRNLGPQGIIRVGGNTSDYSSFDSSGTPLSLPKGTVINARNLRELATFLEATGWNLIWGLNLGRKNLENAVDEAKAVADATGDKLIAFQIGNEPDLFKPTHRTGDWNYPSYLAEYRRYKAAIRARVPHALFAGPDVAIATDWVASFAKDEGNDLKLLTRHYYIGNSALPSSTIGLMLEHDSNLLFTLQEMKAISANSGLPYRMCETNSFYGGGKKGVSDTFGSALWVLDYMFALASEGCAGVNMETGVNHLGLISYYTPIGDNGQGRFTPAPEYYGMLAFSQASRGQQIALDLDSHEINLTAYASATNERQLALTVINKDATRNASVKVTCGDPLKYAAATRLTAPSLHATKNVTLGGATVDEGGRWKAVDTEAVTIVLGQAMCQMPAASAAVIALQT